MKLCFLPLLLLLPACVPLPVPHSTVNAPRFSGRVLDRTTHRPVAGAKVVLGGLDDTETYTDVDGRFLTSISRTKHLAGVYTYDDGTRLQYPPARTSNGILIITKAGYHTAEAAADCTSYPRPFLGDDQVETRKLPEIPLAIFER